MASNGPRGGHTCCLETAQDEVSLRAAEAGLAGSLEGLCTRAPPAHQLLLSPSLHRPRCYQAGATEKDWQRVSLTWDD